MGDTFDVGMVLAGAVSGGAYSAGVMDFLIEALDQWEIARQRSPDEVPNHRVRVTGLTGTSAGAICAALSAFEIARRPPPPRGDNPYYVRGLYESWVVLPDIEAFCQDDDLRLPDRPIASLLNAGLLDTIAARAIEDDREAVPRAYAGDPCDVILTCTNLRGIPYGMDFEGGTYNSLAHADYVSRYFGSKGGGDPAARLETLPQWKAIFEAALASSAFPVGLAARPLVRERAEYKSRTWEVMVAVDDPPTRFRSEYRSIAPNLPAGNRYPVVNVDGGVLDNEPLELARRALSGDAHAPRGRETANRALIMVDAFPDPCLPIDALSKSNALLDVLKGTVGALLREQRFKPQELLLAQDETVFSRFMIAPRCPAVSPHGRGEKGLESPQPNVLATAAASHFGGFLARSFREHDFRLGRRNCQRFLQDTFALDAKNHIFDRWSDSVVDDKRFHPEIESMPGVPDKSFRLLVPTLGSAAEEVKRLPWPRLSARELAEIATDLEARSKSLAAAVSRRAGFAPRGLLIRSLATLFHGYVARRGASWIEQDLSTRGQLDYLRAGGAARESTQNFNRGDEPASEVG